eukprot:scaffold3044_cov176-Ochromonas_danica.AAC.12
MMTDLGKQDLLHRALTRELMTAGSSSSMTLSRMTVVVRINRPQRWEKACPDETTATTLSLSWYRSPSLLRVLSVCLPLSAQQHHQHTESFSVTAASALCRVACGALTASRSRGKDQIL